MNIILDMRKSDRRDLIEACVQFYAQELKIEKKRFTLAVFSKKDLAKDHAANGVAMRLTDGIYGMDLDSRLSMEKLIEVIAHEMVHIKQFATGQLKYKGRSLFWRGEKVIRSRINYYDHPWEIEAWSKEKVLAAKIFKLWMKAEDVHNGKYNRNKSKA